MKPYSLDSGSQVLFEDGERVFRRGWRVGDDGDRSAVLVVLPAAEHPSPSSLDRLAHEYGLKDELDEAWAAQPLDLVRDGGRATLVLKDPGGEPLDLLLGAPMEVGHFLRLASGIAMALGKLHQRGLVHKDIKPTNILVNSATGEVRLTGFGIASRLSRERQAIEPPETLAGTLAYMAPEQTGRMNRSVDSRSDLYALGVSFYQMLTGALPFSAVDPMELVHCHLARRPVPPADRVKAIPSAVSAIIMRLLAKTAEERYQTAVGVENDLRRCLTEWEARRRIDDFPLGGDDTPDRLLVPEKLYGREREVESLLASFNRIVNGGAPELVLVSGYSGIGKSSVVNELHKALVPPHGLFASGKFDQYKRDIPYATLAHAFQSLIRLLLSKSEEELSKWRDRLHDALGPNGKLIVNLVPELQLIIGEPPPVPDLPLQDAQRRFQLAFRRFIGVFARPEHPLALFLDDLQWLDAATLDLVDNLLTRSDLTNLLLIGAYRDNEVDATHPLRRKLETIRSAGGRVEEIALAPLAREHLGHLIADALRCEPARAAPLAQLVHEKTGGNPFFAIQFLYALTEEGLLTFDNGATCWSWDPHRIHAKRYTDNVADLMVGKLSRLPAETQTALQLMACLGNTAKIATLSIVLEVSAEQVESTLWEAIRQELIEPLEGSYRFMHDRVQEAAYSLIPEERRTGAHLRIGQLLAANTPPQQREEAVFDIVNHLNRGAALITAPDKREQLAELNLIAGKRAKAATAYTSALTYLTAGGALLPEDSWERRHELTFALELHRGECEFLTGALTEAEKRLAVLSIRAANTLERATVACLRVDLYTSLDQSSRAIAVGLDYLRHLAIDWSPHPTEEVARREYERIWSQLGSRTIEDLIELPLMSDPASLATVDVLTKLGPPSLQTDANLFSLVICRAVNLSLEGGNCDGSCFAYVRFGMVAGPRFGDYHAGFRFGRLGHDLVEQHGLTRFQARTYMSFGSFVLPWTRHVRAGRDFLHRAFEAANKIGDLTYAAYCCQQLNTNLLAAGDPLSEAEREAKLGLAFAQKTRFGFVIDITATQLGLIRTLRGLTPKFGSFDDGQFDELGIERRFASSPHLAYAACWYLIRKLQARFFAGEYAAAVEASSRAQSLLWTLVSHFETAEYHFYGALSRAALCDSAPAGERQQHLDAIAAHHKQLQLWAENCPENFENRAALVGAEIAHLEGRELDAEHLYEQAIRSARENDFVHNEAIANELAARFYEARGFKTISHAYLQKARYCYSRWGATGKVRQIDKLYPQLREDEPASGLTRTIATPVEHLDLATVIKVSQAVSGEIALEKLIDKLMRAAIEHAGAQRGLLIGPRNDELQIEAEATTKGEDITVRMRDGVRKASTLPESLVRYVMRTQETIILDDASTQTPFSADPYVAEHRARSILCLPLITQGKLVGILYLENNLTPHVFTADRLTVLKVLASQAAISLEISRLYSDLQERETKIRRLVDANVIGITVTDIKGQMREANDAFLEMVGHAREDLISGRLQWTDLTPPEWHNHTLRAIADLKRTGTVQPYEKEYFRKDGSRVPVLIGGAAFGNPPDQAVAFVVDLTDRKRAEVALRDSEEALRRREKELRDLLETIPAMTVTVLPDGSDVFIGKRFVEYSGLSADKARRSGWKATAHPDDVDEHVSMWRSSLVSGEPIEIETRFRSADGEYRWFLARAAPLRDDQGNILNWYEVLTDIEDRKRAEMALRSSEEALRRSEAYLVEAQQLSHTGSVACNETSNIHWSDETYRILGFDPLDGLPSHEAVMQRVHPDDRKRFVDVTSRGAREKTDYKIEFRIMFSDETIKYIELAGHPKYSADGEFLEVVGTIIDVTERKRAQDEHERLGQLETDLAHMNRLSMMGELSASLAHEMKQPIAAARNNARAAMNFLNMHPPDLREVREALDCVVGDADRAGNIIDRVRDQIKKAPPREERFDLNEAIKEVMVLARGAITKNAVSDQVRLKEGALFVVGDRVQLQQVLLNLILNAIEAMGSVQEGPRELSISTEQTEDRGALVLVLDSGPGIDKKHLERVFEPFYTTKVSGLGMGLSICRSIIDAHGGRLWVEANKPRGARFQFTLPTTLPVL
jgi:PAS domain S-box-containing protein